MIKSIKVHGTNEKGDSTSWIDRKPLKITDESDKYGIATEISNDLAKLNASLPEGDYDLVIHIIRK